MPLDYGMPVRTMWNGKLSTGEEVTYFTSDDGYVCQDNTGTSLTATRFKPDSARSSTT